MKSVRMHALCDILGFKQMVTSNKLDHVVERGLGWLSRVLHHAIHRSDFPDASSCWSELCSDSQLGVMWFSDTFLFYTREDTDDSIRRLLQVLAWMHFETIVSHRAMLRSAVTYGESYIDEESSIAVGKPIVEAYELEREQDWSGGILSRKAVLRLPHVVQQNGDFNWWVVPYKVPFKNDKHCQSLAINWTQGLLPPGWQMNWSEESSNPTDEDLRESPDIAAKFQNTKRFYMQVCPWE